MFRNTGALNTVPRQKSLCKLGRRLLNAYIIIYNSLIIGKPMKFTNQTLVVLNDKFKEVNIICLVTRTSILVLNSRLLLTVFFLAMKIFFKAGTIYLASQDRLHTTFYFNFSTNTFFPSFV